jgi:hypothetical protein
MVKIENKIEITEIKTVDDFMSAFRTVKAKKLTNFEVQCNEVGEYSVLAWADDVPATPKPKVEAETEGETVYSDEPPSGTEFE